MAKWTRGEVLWVIFGALACAVGLLILVSQPIDDIAWNSGLGGGLAAGGGVSIGQTLGIRARRRSGGRSPWG